MTINTTNLFNPLEIGDFNDEGFDSVPSEDFDYGNGCSVAPVQSAPEQPKLTKELLTKLANKPATTSMGKLWQHLWKEQLENWKD